MGTLLSAAELDAWRLTGEDVVLVDCRFSLGDKQYGERSYAEGHLPGAHFFDLERDLSGEVVPGVTGRHPLPSLDGLARKLGAAGVGPETRVVAYDQGNGMFAARLWWLCRFLGHEAVWVLEGGVEQWLSEGRALVRELPTPRQGDFSTLLLQAESIVAVDEVEALLEHPEATLFDARAADRFRGENETIDPVAGHIPGARSFPFAENLAGFRFHEREQLAARFATALAGKPADQAVVYCGSGVTACHLILAAEHAGFSGMRLYPGSFSEWITDRARPVATGDNG